MPVPHCVINYYNLDTYNGVLKFLNEEISSTFLPYEDKTAALKMYKFLVKYANDDDLLKCHQIVCHEKKWLLAFEDCLNARKAGRSSCQSIYTENLIKCLFITRKDSECWVKVLPNLDGPKSKMNDDIEEFKKLMDIIINYPFELDKPDYDCFNLSLELRYFLHYLNSEFLEYVSPRCLLDSPFIWGDADKYRFLINLDYLLKREVFKLESFNDTLTTFASANLGDWVHALYNKRVLYKVYYHSQKSYNFSRAVAVVQFCSNVFWHYNNYAIECRERKIGKIRIMRKLSEALPNLFIDLFEGCINHACNLEDLYQPKTHEAVKRVFRKPLTSEYRD
ncbi:hypothetical protein ES332_A06G031700v1 [Gossypium tomentosum]|uniref:Uncharacterized protein n=1 Tax=Gossypium tomentosum TaxID=34277 RepID=A0A5D2PZ56_GOSTO|nr:hypothetical protein ES332_A06G031700v1 [Gossypium tomentosum]